MPSTTDRYCVVGAGPAGLVMARALRHASIPFDVFERHSDVGGIWDPDNPAAPSMTPRTSSPRSGPRASTASRCPTTTPTTPAPPAAGVHPRVRREFGLYDHISFDTEVEWARPDGEEWIVKLKGG